MFEYTIYRHHGLNVFTYQNVDYAIGTLDSVCNAIQSYAEDNLHKFDTATIAKHSVLSEKAILALIINMGKDCVSDLLETIENFNDLLIDLVLDFKIDSYLSDFDDGRYTFDEFLTHHNYIPTYKDCENLDEIYIPRTGVNVFVYKLE